MSKQVDFKCLAIRQTFKAQDSEYKIYAVDEVGNTLPKNNYGNITILGNLPDLQEGVEYQVKALEENGKYGKQYRVLSIQRDKPISANGVRMFLREILTDRQADELLKHYPNIIDLVINNKSHEVDLSKTHDIKEARFAVIKRKILENFIFAQIIDEFNGLIDFKTVQSLYSKYECAEKIKSHLKNDPYDSIINSTGKSFKEVDNMLLKFEKELNKLDSPPFKFAMPLIESKSRIMACANYVLSENETEGNTKMKYKDLENRCKLLAKDAIDLLDDCLSGTIYLDSNGWVSKRATYENEKSIAKKLLNLRDSGNLWTLEYEKDDTLTDEQWSSIDNVANGNVCGLIGGAGMGKSFSTQKLIDVLDKNDKTYLILASTGKASRVVASYTNRSASTVHRILFSLQDDEVINSDIVILDEVSMVDVSLMSWLLANVSENTKFLFIGDSAQLASIGCGNVLHDIINSKAIPITMLTKIFRYGIGGITSAATDIRMGKSPLRSFSELQVLGDDKGYIYYSATENRKALTLIKKVYAKLLESTPPEDIMVLSPFNISDVGVVAINKILKPIANPQSTIEGATKMECASGVYHINDVVIQKKNNYKSPKFRETYKNNIIWSIEESRGEHTRIDTFISNGDIGKVEYVDNEYCVINFDGERVVYDKFEMGTCLHAYSMSLHASQGGNAKNVIMLTMPTHTRMLNSNLLYVGVTRAREKVVHIGDMKSINQCVTTKEEFKRDTRLREMLERGIDD